jgi:hypothetical protein
MFDLTVLTDRAACLADSGESCSKTAIFKIYLPAIDRRETESPAATR